MTDLPPLDAETPIVVDPSAIPGNITLALRQLAIAIGAWAAARGYLDGSTASMIAGIAPVVASIVWGQVRRYLDHRNLVIAANAAPDSVAVVAQPIPPKAG